LSAFKTQKVAAAKKHSAATFMFAIFCGFRLVKSFLSLAKIFCYLTPVAFLVKSAEIADFSTFSFIPLSSSTVIVSPSME
jgi:hypothetical protein